MKPLVTALVDTYNHERFIEEAIVSVLEQDFPASELEVIVVDDGSTDRTPEIVRKFEPRVRLIRKLNGGQASAFNAGIPEARGEFISFLDGDDWWAKAKLRAVVETFGENPRAGTVGHGIVEVDSESNKCRSLAPVMIGYFDLANDDGAQTFRSFMAFLGTSRLSIRKCVLRKILPIPESLVVEADEFMAAMSVAYGGAVLLAVPLTFYRLHGDNLYQFKQCDPVRTRRKIAVSECLAELLPISLRGAGVTSSAIDLIVEPIELFAARMRLSLDGGSPLETYRVERADFRLSYRGSGLGYRAYKEASLLLTLLLPPRTYYKVRRWYATSNFRRMRSWLGEPTPIAHIRERAAHSEHASDNSTNRFKEQSGI
jgi:glycosyltransferase involved in cell wall biosynthesis